MWRRGRFLLISRHRALSRLLKAEFECGFGNDDIEIATSRNEALILIAQRLPDLTLLDLYLGNESGLALASELTALHPQLSMMFIVSQDQVASVPDGDRHAAAQMGIEILHKDIGDPNKHSGFDGLVYTLCGNW